MFKCSFSEYMNIVNKKGVSQVTAHLISYTDPLCRISRCNGYRSRTTYTLSTIAALDVGRSYNRCLRCNCDCRNCISRPDKSHLKLLVELLDNTLAAVFRLVCNHHGRVNSDNRLCACIGLPCNRTCINSAWSHTIVQAIPLAQVFSNPRQILWRACCDSNRR